MKAMDTTALVLIVIGGINWGLVGFFNYNLVDGIFGEGSVVARVIYAVVGLAALWALGSLVSRVARREEVEA